MEIYGCRFFGFGELPFPDGAFTFAQRTLLQCDLTGRSQSQPKSVAALQDMERRRESIAATCAVCSCDGAWPCIR